MRKDNISLCFGQKSSKNSQSYAVILADVKLHVPFPCTSIIYVNTIGTFMTISSASICREDWIRRNSIKEKRSKNLVVYIA